MSDQLKPCPFCNQQAVASDGMFGSVVHCDHLHTCPLDGQEQLAAGVHEWNTRAQPNTCTKDGGQCGQGGYCEPCPFCGSTDLQMVIGDLCHWTECQKCEATGPAEFKDGDECDPTWNARANPSDGAIANAASPCSSRTEATGQFLKRFTTTL